MTTVEPRGRTVSAELEHLTFLRGALRRRWTMLAVALGFAVACGTAGYAQTPSGGADKMGKDQMMDKKQ